MGITKKYLEDLGLTAEQVSGIFAERGKEITEEKAKLDALTLTISEKDRAIAEYGEKIKTYDGSDATLKELQEKVVTYEKSEAERIANEAKQKQESELRSRFDSLLGENKFKHEDIANGRYNAFKQLLADENSKGKGDADIFTEITKDMDCFVNPQQAKVVLPGGKFDIGTLDGVEKAFMARNPNIKL